VLEAVFAPIAFALIVLVVVAWALARRFRRPQSGTGRTETSEVTPTDESDFERRRRYGS
jgi:hypothetical protein